MIDVKGKRLLVLGGTAASVDVVKEAHEMGVHVAVTDKERTGVAKEIADESYMVSTTDIDGLKQLIKDRKIDGVFCGPSEFNLLNVMNLCEAADLPFYATRKQWETCSNKSFFKELCRKFGVPCVPEYSLTNELRRDDLDKINYPVIIKPVDGCSSKGLSVCYNEKELVEAVPLALEYSASCSFIVEKYITNDYGFGCRYIANDGQIILSAVNDRYTVDSAGGKIMISVAALFPSKKIGQYIKSINDNVVHMFQSIGIKNGTIFMQALVDDDGQIYFHEMGFRLSGGLWYSMFKAACGYSDLGMMIRYALGLPMMDPSEMKKIDPYFHGKFIGSLCIPLRAGTIYKIKGIDKIKNDSTVIDILQYYYEGDSIEPDKIGTLMQHFCRIKILTSSREQYIQKINWIQDELKIVDKEGRDMIYRKFDTNRMYVEDIM